MINKKPIISTVSPNYFNTLKNNQNKNDQNKVTAIKPGQNYYWPLGIVAIN